MKWGGWSLALGPVVVACALAVATPAQACDIRNCVPGAPDVPEIPTPPMIQPYCQICEVWQELLTSSSFRTSADGDTTFVTGTVGTTVAVASSTVRGATARTLTQAGTGQMLPSERLERMN